MFPIGAVVEPGGMWKATAVGVAVGVLLLTGACGNDEPDHGDTVPGPAVTPSVTVDGHGHDSDHDDHDHDYSAYDRQKLAAFVMTFRTNYPQLASESDDDIEDIVFETCRDLAQGVDPQMVEARIVERAEDDGRMPTPEQARQIYDLVVPICP